MKRVLWVVVGMLMMGGVGLSWSYKVYAGENAGVTVTLDLEKEEEGEAGDQGHLTVQNVGPGETVVLSIYGNGLSNVYSYAIEVQFDTTKVVYVEGGATNVGFAEFDVFSAAGLFVLAPDPENPSIIGAASALLPKPTADKAPDGDGKLLVWMKFTTRASMQTSDEVRFSVVKAQFKGLDEVLDDVPSNQLPMVFLNFAEAVEFSHWGQIKALFR